MKVTVSYDAALQTKTRARITKHNKMCDQHAALETQAGKIVEDAGAVLTSTDDGWFDKISSARAELAETRLAAARLTCEILASKSKLLDDIVRDLGKAHTQLAKDRDEAQGEAEKQLREAGREPESRPGFDVNPTVFKRQFEAEVTSTRPVRERQALVDDCAASLRSATAQRKLVDAEVDLAERTAAALVRGFLTAGLEPPKLAPLPKAVESNRRSVIRVVPGGVFAPGAASGPRR